ncbi:putative SOS response-associated peptidase YedK [Cupriavidus alkaliphilus]|nr:putative SOS response-associated peptidase YedK [Cupriavidus alkaliphilus]
MNRMHAPGKEKSSVVIVPRQQWDEWLASRDPEVARTFMTILPPDAMATEPASIVRRSKEQQPASDQDNQLPL